MAIRVKFWGVRGSIPTPKSPKLLEEKVKFHIENFFDSGFSKKSEVQNYISGCQNWKVGGFGGNTTCLSVQTDDTHLIIDAGSGIRVLGNSLLGGPLGKGQGTAHIYFTHFHWDHLVGLPFFVPIFIPGNQIHLYMVGNSLEEMMKTVFRKPFFPVPFEALGANIHFHCLEPRKPFQFNDLTLTPYELDHPDPCWGLKITDGKKFFSHCVDTEATRVSRDALGDDLPLYQNTDLMVFDAQYTLREAIERVDWGHAAATIGLDIAIREKIPRVLFTHPDPHSSDEQIYEAVKQTERYHAALIRQSEREGAELFQVDWSFAIEGLEIEV